MELRIVRSLICMKQLLKQEALRYEYRHVPSKV